MQTPLSPKLAAPVAAGLRTEIRVALRKAGLLRRSWFRSTLRTLALLTALGTTLAVSWTTPSIPLLVGLVIAEVPLLAALGFVGHDAMHRSLSENRRLNDILGRTASGLVMGVGYGEWRSEHLGHHRVSQVDGADPDMDAPPFVSLTSRAHAAKRGWLRRLCCYQQYYVWFLSLLLIFKLRLVSQRRVYRAPRLYSLDLAFLAGHWVLWFALPLAVLDASVGRTLVVYLGGTALLGAHFAAVFWVNHIGMAVIAEDDRPSYLEHQVCAARNIRCHPVFDWLFGGLNFHIEHHLEPACPSGRLRAAHEVIRPLLGEHRIPCMEVSWPRALADIRRHLREVTGPRRLDEEC